MNNDKLARDLRVIKFLLEDTKQPKTINSTLTRVGNNLPKKPKKVWVRKNGIKREAIKTPSI